MATQNTQTTQNNSLSSALTREQLDSLTVSQLLWRGLISEAHVAQMLRKANKSRKEAATFVRQNRVNQAVAVYLGSRYHSLPADTTPEQFHAVRADKRLSIRIGDIDTDLMIAAGISRTEVHNALKTLLAAGVLVSNRSVIKNACHTRYGWLKVA
jgi:hypothetical protein